MHITIDGKKAIFTDRDTNIVEVAAKAGIGIPAPCYRSNQKKGCCNACVIEVDGRQVYACGTKPLEGMNVAVRRYDLDTIRKERIIKYKEKSNQECACLCDCNTEPTAGVNCC